VKQTRVKQLRGLPMVTQPRGATGGGMRRGTDKCEVTGQWGHGFVGPEVSDIFQFCVKEGADSPVSMNHNRVIPSQQCANSNTKLLCECGRCVFMREKSGGMRFRRLECTPQAVILR
jgi:hypothetical protein